MFLAWTASACYCFQDSWPEVLQWLEMPPTRVLAREIGYSSFVIMRQHT